MGSGPRKDRNYIAKDVQSVAEKASASRAKIAAQHLVAIKKLRAELLRGKNLEELQLLAEQVVGYVAFDGTESLGGLRYSFKSASGLTLSISIEHKEKDNFILWVSHPKRMHSLYRDELKFSNARAQFMRVLGFFRSY